MGSPLGPTFADFYMSELENKILKSKFEFNPLFYVRYVDDTCVIFKSLDHVTKFTEKLEEMSELKFTYETSLNNEFNFLDVKMFVKEDGSIERKVYLKPTDKGLFMNFNSFTPLNYKVSIIKTLVHRAYKIATNYDFLDQELKRISQSLVNNEFPQYLVEKTINNTLNSLLNKENVVKDDKIILYYQSETVGKIKLEESKLKNIIKQHIVGTSNEKLVVRSYFKPRKLSSCFSTRMLKQECESVNVVYQYTCSEVGCNANYIGYTTNTLRMRMLQHKYKPSKIFAHMETEHGKSFDNDILNHFKILARKSDFHELRLAESLFIRKFKPDINIKFNEMADFLKVFI
jgi:hypothetical protein